MSISYLVNLLLFFTSIFTIQLLQLQISSELRTLFFVCWFDLFGYFPFLFTIILSVNYIGGQQDGNHSPLAALNMVQFMICFWYASFTFKNFSCSFPISILFL